MASQSQGIQQLLAAEKRAAEKVAEARKRKAKRLKQAKDEAQAEIDAYKKERENQFKLYESQVLGSKDDMANKIDESTQTKIAEINTRVNKYREEALRSLLNIVYDIKSEMHINLK